MWWLRSWCKTIILLVFIIGSLPSIANAFAFGQLSKVEVLTTEKMTLPKWTRVIEASRHEQQTYVTCIQKVEDCSQSDLVDWQRFLQKISILPVRQQVEQVNRYVNKTPYQEDKANYGLSDYWATPIEFFGNSGDCEDYAIAKYISLRQLGLPISSLKMVVLQDTLRDLAHAVLAVRVEDETLILDNISDYIAPPSKLTHYAPYYAINEQQQWLYYDRPQRLTSSNLLPAKR